MLYIAMRKRLEEREEGFTLIELLVVVIIIGILAAIAIPVFLNQRARGWAATAESDARNAAIAVETAFTQNGTYTDGAAQRTLAGAEDDLSARGSLADFKPSAGVATVFDAVAGGNYCIISRHTNSTATTDYTFLPSNGTASGIATGACVGVTVPGATG